MTTHPTRLATSASTPLSTAQRTEVPQKCYVTGKVPDPKICPAQFRVNTDSRQKCYEYCYYTASCEMFSFKSGDTVCFLYKEYLCDWQPTKERWITGLKKCLLQMVSNQKCLTITEFSADGGYIKQQYSGKCLGVTSSKTIDGNETHYSLTWTFCKAANRWLAVPRDNNLTALSISQPQSGLCLAAAATPTDIIYLSVQSTCSSSLNTSFQLSYALQEDEKGKLCGVYLKTPGRRLINEWSDDGYQKQYPSLLRFHVTPVTVLAAPCDRVDVRNGVIFPEDSFSNVSIYVPGERITVLCNEGYGIKQKSYANRIELVCGDDAWGGTTVRCRKRDKNKKKAKEKIEFEDLYLVAAVGLLVITPVIIFFVILLSFGKTIKQSCSRPT